MVDPTNSIGSVQVRLLEKNESLNVDQFPIIHKPTANMMGPSRKFSNVEILALAKIAKADSPLFRSSSERKNPLLWSLPRPR